jgi:hypothetical protein
MTDLIAELRARGLDGEALLDELVRLGLGGTRDEAARIVAVSELPDEPDGDIVTTI